MDSSLAVGIDVGASYTKIGLVNSAGQMLEHCVIPSELQSNDPKPFLTNTRAVVAQILARQPVQGIGICLCSILNPERTGVLLSVNAPALAGLDIRQAFADSFGLPVHICNDAAAFALAEARFGAGQGFRRVLCLALGTGLAIAAVIDGRVLETWGGISADAGRIILDARATVTCQAGVRGSAEALCNSAHILRLARAAYGREDVTVRQVVEAASAGEPAASQVMAQIGGNVGHLLALLSPVFFPQVILITGGPAEAGPPLFDAVRQRYAELIGDYLTTLARLERKDAPPVEIHQAILGPEAAVVGAVLGFF